MRVFVYYVLLAHAREHFLGLRPSLSTADEGSKQVEQITIYLPADHLAIDPSLPL